MDLTFGKCPEPHFNLHRKSFKWWLGEDGSYVRSHSVQTSRVASLTNKM